VTTGYKDKITDYFLFIFIHFLSLQKSF